MTNRITNHHYLLDRIGKGKDDKNQVKQFLQKQAKDFREILEQAKQSSAEEVKISKHAEKRLQMRNIRLSEKRLRDLSEAMDRAGEKGIKEALIIVDGNALIASIKNKTIVTCARQDSLDAKIITNIDGAIVL